MSRLKRLHLDKIRPVLVEDKKNYNNNDKDVVYRWHFFSSLSQCRVHDEKIIYKCTSRIYFDSNCLWLIFTEITVIVVQGSYFQLSWSLREEEEAEMKRSF